MYNVIVNGAAGKMGQEACKALRAHPHFNLVGELGRADDLQEEIARNHADIVVDLTRADSVFKNTKLILEAGARPVIGTSGLSMQDIAELQALANKKQLGGIIAPNFSVAAVLMMRFAEMASKYLPDVEIIEGHHPAKYDAPSGTAMKTAELIAKARHNAPGVDNTKEIIPGARGAKYEEIPIHALRLPGLIAGQQVLFGSMGETLSIHHTTIDRSSFMPGLLLCCEKVIALQRLLYGMESILFDKSTA